MSNEPTVHDPVRARLEEIRDRAEAATPAPWLNEPDTHAGRVWVLLGPRGTKGDLEPLFNVRSGDRYAPEDRAHEHAQRARDAAFITEARADVPALLAAVTETLNLHPRRHAVLGQAPEHCGRCRCAWPCAEYRALADALGVSS